MDRPRRIRGRLAAILLGLLLGGSSVLSLGAGCEDRAVSPSPDGRDVTVMEGGDVQLATGDRIFFRKVATDSRCPQGLECFWEGEASTSFSLRASRLETPFTLGIFGSLVAADTALSMQRFQPVQVGRYRMTLLQLDPYPKAGRDPLAVRSRALIRVEY